MATNAWYQICLCWEEKDGKYKLLLDGAVIAEGTNFKKGVRIQKKGLFVIGECPWNSNGCFPAFLGKISSVNMWSKMAAEGVISEIAQQPKCEIKTGDIFSWPMFGSGKGKFDVVSSVTRCKTPGERKIF